MPSRVMPAWEVKQEMSRKNRMIVKCFETGRKCVIFICNLETPPGDQSSTQNQSESVFQVNFPIKSQGLSRIYSVRELLLFCCLLAFWLFCSLPCQLLSFFASKCLCLLFSWTKERKWKCHLMEMEEGQKDLRGRKEKRIKDQGEE